MPKGIYKNPPHNIACVTCGKRFIPSQIKSKFCSKICSSKQERSPNALFFEAQRSAKERAIPWSIPLWEYVELRSKSCFYCGGQLNKRGIGLDRLENSKGYSVDNVVPCCFDCNSVKGVTLTPQQTLHIMRSVRGARRESSYRIYLAGKIFPSDPYFSRWRKEAEEFLFSRGMVPMNPLLSKEVLFKDSNLYPANDILMRDYRMVVSSNLILANLKLVGDNGKINEPIIGTFGEIAWAWDEKKPIIAVVDKENTTFQEHPFLKGMITHWFYTVEAALENIATYWNWQYHARFGE